MGRIRKYLALPFRLLALIPAYPCIWLLTIGDKIHGKRVVKTSEWVD